LDTLFSHDSYTATAEVAWQHVAALRVDAQSGSSASLCVSSCNTAWPARAAAGRQHRWVACKPFTADGACDALGSRQAACHCITASQLYIYECQAILVNRSKCSAAATQQMMCHLVLPTCQQCSLLFVVWFAFPAANAHLEHVLHCMYDRRAPTSSRQQAMLQQHSKPSRLRTNPGALLA
jgi:hypothetical protein